MGSFQEFDKFPVIPAIFNAQNEREGKLNQANPAFL